MIVQGRRPIDPIGLFSCISLLHNQAHDLRVCAGIEGRAKRGGAGASASCCRSQEGVSGSGERSQDRPATASPVAGRDRGRRRADLDRLARSTRDLLNTLAAITAKKAGFKSLGDTWADTTTSHGRLMLTVLGGLAEFDRDLIRARTGEGRARAVARGQKMGRPFKLTDHQKREAIKRRNQGETLADIARSYNVSPATISRLTA